MTHDIDCTSIVVVIIDITVVVVTIDIVSIVEDVICRR